MLSKQSKPGISLSAGIIWMLLLCVVQVRLLATNLTKEDVLPVKDKLADALFAGAAGQLACPE